MNYFYKKMHNKNYLVLDDFDNISSSKDYSYEMIRRNHIDGLMSLNYSMVDNLPSYYYDITSRQSFSSCFYELKLKKEQLVRFFGSLHSIINNLNKFLLDYDHLVLLPQCIFCDKDMSAFYFAYCPDYKQNFFTSLKEFVSYLLTITDHDDEKTILVSYALWQEVQNDNFNLKSLMDVLEKHNSYESVPQPVNPLPLPDINTNEEYKILKEPAVLLKENYSYDTSFLIKTIGTFTLVIILLIINVILKIFSIYSTELFFIILTTLVVFSIFFTAKLIRIAPLHKKYDKPEVSEPDNVIKINTTVTVATDNEDDNNETVLLCVNPTFTDRVLIYSGIDYFQEATIKTYPFLIGKSETNHMIINNPSVSRRHARITFENDYYYIEDLNSSNGTRINDELIPAYTLTKINIGDTITFAHLTYIFQ